MALTKREHEDLLMEIALSGGDTPKMLELMQKLRDDFDDREGQLRRYNEERDRKPPEGQRTEERRIERQSEEDNREDGGERRDAYDALSESDPGAEDSDKAETDPGVRKDTVSRADYEDLKRKYIERFFSTPAQAKRDQVEDTKEDDNSDELTFEELFKKREG